MTRREEFLFVGLDVIDDLLLLQPIILSAGTKETERGTPVGSHRGLVPFPGFIGLQVAKETLGRLEDEEIDLQHIAEGIKDLEMRARDVARGEETEATRQAGRDLRTILGQTERELHVRLMDR
jgi:hypothetical protein